MRNEKIERLKHLDDMSIRGFTTAEEESERSVLRAQIQEEERLKAAKQVQKTSDNVSGGQSPSEVSREVSPEVCSRQRLTFREAMSRAGKQIALDCFSQRVPNGSYIAGPDYQLASTLCMVMAEVYMAASHHVMYVGGIAMEAEQVQEVYSHLKPEHIECIMRKILQSRGKAIKYQRPYLRTMLYNIVFEYEAQTQAGMDIAFWDT